MRYGIMIDNSGPLDAVVDRIRQHEQDGFAFAASSHIFGYDALVLLAVAGARVPRIGLATAVVPTYPRHPVALAQEALTVQAATGNRLTLGIGLSHQVVIENVFGTSFDKPARHMREYLSILMPVLRGEQVTFKGETLSANTFGPLEPKVEPPSVLLAALAPRMLELAGSVADGTTTWMVGPDTLASHIVPSITVAAERAGRAAPTISVQLPVCVTDDVEGARERAAQIFAVYGGLPSYAAMIEKEGADGPAGLAVVGDEDAVRAHLGRVADAGATDFGAAPFGTTEELARTNALLVELAAG